MLLKDKKIAIIGGGPGGLTLAILLKLQNLDVKVYERDLDKNARVQGSPLDLHTDSGLAAIEKAGLMEDFKKNYLPGAHKTSITNASAEVLFSDHGIDDVAEGFAASGFRPEIDRGVLRKILLNALGAEDVIWNSQFLSMEKKGTGWLLHFKNGTSSYADVVIGSDGANSKIRPYLTTIKPVYTGITMLEGNIDNAEKAAPEIAALLRGGKVMAFGNEKNILMGQKAGGDVGFYASFKAPEGWAAASGIDFSNRRQVLNWFKNAYSDWNDIWQVLFLRATTPFIPRPVYCAPLNQDWKAQPNLTIIGDAAHVMPPFAGEGVNMAMLDALELSECFAGNAFTSIEAAIGAYEAHMRFRAGLSARESLDNGEKMHHAQALDNMLAFFKAVKSHNQGATGAHD